MECIRELALKASRSTILKGTTYKDPSWPSPPHASAYYPFRSHIDLFRFRTTASYYMCLHALNRRSQLKRFDKDRPQQQCLHGLNTIKENFDNQRYVPDYRRDDEDFQCALVAFCPG
ncbi:hypothetical protein ACOMHN_043494 [Nucella lapillus]